MRPSSKRARREQERTERKVRQHRRLVDGMQHIKSLAEVEAILDAVDPPIAPEIRAAVKARLLAAAPHLHQRSM